MNLRETQALLWRAITWPTGVDAFLAQADPATRKAFAETFAETEAFSRSARVQVYAEAYFWRLYEVIVDQYPVTAWLAGGTRFHDFVTDYVLAQPSRTPDIRRFAASLPTFLSTHGLATRTPGLAGLARVDAAIADAVDLPDEPRLTTEDFAQLPPERWPSARIALTQTATLVPCPLPYAEFRKAWADEGPPPNLPPLDPDGCALVWRQANHDVYHRMLTPPEARALHALRDGGTFAEACDAAAGRDTTGATAADVVQWLQRWLRDDLLVALRL